MKNKIIKIVLVILLLMLPLTGCQEQDTKVDPRGISYFDFFDTVSYIYSYASDDDETFYARTDATAEVLEYYHKLFDIYNEYEGMNNLCTINKMAGIEKVEVDEELITFLLYAIDLCEKTNYEMNIMIGSVTSIWHEFRTLALADSSKAAIPTEEELLEANKHTNISSLEIDVQNNTVYINDYLASIDVGAIGKGYATERAADYLFSIGAESYVLNIGGNIRIIGDRKDKDGWVTGVRDPKTESDYALKIRITDTACVTSGVYERYYYYNGVRYHHIVDKDTLQPSQYFDSLTVITKDSGLADCLSTALFCMSFEEGLELLKKFDNVGIIWIFSDGEIRYTDNIKNLIVE